MQLFLCPFWPGVVRVLSKGQIDLSENSYYSISILENIIVCRLKNLYSTFFQIFVFKLNLLCWSSRCLYCFWWTAQVFIPLMSFLLYILFSRSFLVFLRYSFKFFYFYLHLFDGVRFKYSQVFVSFLFSECSIFFLSGSSIPTVTCCFHLFFISMAFFSIPNSILISCLYILTASIGVSNS